MKERKWIRFKIHVGKKVVVNKNQGKRRREGRILEVMSSNPGDHDTWTFAENKTFEQVLAQFMDQIHPYSSDHHHHYQISPVSSSVPAPPRPPWTKIASVLPGKSLSQIRHHYDLLLHDIASIDTGLITPPDYSSHPLREHHHTPLAPIHRSPPDHPHRFPAPPSGIASVNPTDNWPQFSPPHLQQRSMSIPKSSSVVAGSMTVPKPSSVAVAGSAGHGRGSKANNLEQERKKGIPWTEEEHRLFLLGLDKFGKGDWRSISRNFVVSRTPTQVASHAQKYFIRLNSINKEKRRSSIHDITSPTTPTINDHLTPLSPSMTIPSPPRPSMPSLSVPSSHSLPSQVASTNPKSVPIVHVANRSIAHSNSPSMFNPSPSDILPFTPHTNSLVHQQNL